MAWPLELLLLFSSNYYSKLAGRQNRGTARVQKQNRSIFSYSTNPYIYILWKTHCTYTNIVMFGKQLKRNFCVRCVLVHNSTRSRRRNVHTHTHTQLNHICVTEKKIYVISVLQYFHTQIWHNIVAKVMNNEHFR